MRERYGVEPGQVPDFIVLRGDPSDKLPGAKGVGPKTAADVLCQHGSLEGALEAGRFSAEAGALRLYRRMATLDREAPLPPLDDQEPRCCRALAKPRDAASMGEGDLRCAAFAVRPSPALSRTRWHCDVFNAPVDGHRRAVIQRSNLQRVPYSPRGRAAADRAASLLSRIEILRADVALCWKNDETATCQPLSVRWR